MHARKVIIMVSNAVREAFSGEISGEGDGEAVLGRRGE
jgi:hypothetical protein